MATKSERYAWTCPGCGKRYGVKIGQKLKLCPKCRSDQAGASPEAPAAPEWFANRTAGKNVFLPHHDHGVPESTVPQIQVPRGDVAIAQTSHRQRRRVPWWMLVLSFVLAGITFVVVLVVVTSVSTHARLDVPLIGDAAEKLADAVQAGGQIRSDKNAVRTWLRENSRSGEWEEIRWWPPAPLYGSAEYHRYHEVPRMFDTVNWPRIKKEGRSIRLKYRSKGALGMMVRDAVFIINERGEVYDSIVAEDFRLPKEPMNHYAKRIGASDAESVEIQERFLSGNPVDLTDTPEP